MQIRKGKSNTRTQWLNPKKLVKSNQIYSSIFEESRKCNLRAKHLGKKKNVERITKTIKLPRKKQPPFTNTKVRTNKLLYGAEHSTTMWWWFLICEFLFPKEKEEKERNFNQLGIHKTEKNDYLMAIKYQTPTKRTNPVISSCDAKLPAAYHTNHPIFSLLTQKRSHRTSPFLSLERVICIIFRKFGRVTVKKADR